MDATQVADMFGVMALLAVLGALGAVAAGVLHAPSRRAMRDAIDTHARTSVWLVAAVATAGSLWFSEAANFPPCILCWYQRIAMYPLVVVLGLRLLRPGGSRDLRLAGVVLAGIGLAINLWHVAIETFPGLDTGACDAAVPCTIRWVEGLGFFTIPRLATVAFGMVLVGLLLDRSDRDGTSAPAPYDGSTPRTLEQEHA
jgi:disulfide bond formation protein DsbB